MRFLPAPRLNMSAMLGVDDAAGLVTPSAFSFSAPSRLNIAVMEACALRDAFVFSIGVIFPASGVCARAAIGRNGSKHAL